ncbi:TPA: FdhF/YdeP family oxidoreductase [Escherichia coli]|nr:FdhF/YdeP family oxidoreductase [Escherichia coli]HAP0428413.1 FdhF/YdeP family oxidoreductase [Escherichia coli]HAP0433025.1 FdhF/YdeP family oxidoreductase [Escherichia coli]
MKKKIESYQGAAGGWGAVKSVANAVRKQMDIRQDVIAMFDMNKPEGFDCPGCAWPDPKHSASFDICENGAKAIAWEVTDKQVNASFFAENTVQSLLTWGDHELEAAGRLTQPLKYDDVSDCYKPLSWQQAFDEIGARLQSYSDPNQVEFYTSGRTSNEAAFLYQLFAREYGSNNFPDCSNMCHEPTSVGLAASIGVGKGTVLLEDFEKCDLVICIGHNPGTNHPRMLTSLRALVKRGAKMIAINPLQERGLERFTAPQNPFEMLTNSETQLASAYYNVRIGGDMALLKGMMRLLIERDDAASAAGRPSLLDDEFIQTHTVGFDELRRDVLNSEWKDIERISGLSQTQIAELADAYAAAERTIICYGMGITQHEHGTQNVQQLVNLLLMKGNIGKPGAGICPLRGHSKVVDTYKIGIDKAIEAAQKSTPTLLSLMDEGVRFTNGYVAHGVSGPSRAAIMTGRAPARFGVYSNTDAQDGIPLTETFLPELFQNHGYYTAAVGKWHLSKISNVPVPEDKQTRDYHDNFTTFSAEEWQPQNRGFDYFMGFHAAGTAYYNSPSLFKNRERVPAKGYISDQLTDEAIGVVDRAKTLDQPFMLYLAYNAPHLPNDNPAPEQYQKQFNTGSQTADNYYASVYSVDQGVKRILEQLKKNGQYDNTIILFTSDNGAVIDGPLPLNGAQKGYKSQTYPGGTHTPMFMWWKGKLQPGNYDKLISAMDFYPTALDAADISIPKDLKLDGVSLLPWLQNKKQGEPHKNLTWITSYSHWFDEENIPFWDNYHKFVRHQSDDYPHNPNTEDLSQFSYTVRNNDYSLVYTVENNQLGLYKLTDLQQKDNLAAANPQVVKEMQGVVREFIDNSQPPLSEVNQEKFNNIKKALSEAK